MGGNDTQRNSISGGVMALNKYPDQYQKLRENPSLIPNMVSEIIRWQTPEKLIIDRPNARAHVAFGFGVHRCMGNRLAEMQLRILWEEIMKRFHTIEVVDDVKRLPNIFVRGIKNVPARLHPI